MKNKNSNEKEEKLKELIIQRIEARMSSKLRLSIGSEGTFDKQKMIEHIKKGDSVGRKIIESHLNFMKAQASGQLLKELNAI